MSGVQRVPEQLGRKEKDTRLNAGGVWPGSGEPARDRACLRRWSLLIQGEETVSERLKKVFDDEDDGGGEVVSQKEP